jgi:hypothetical protein
MKRKQTFLQQSGTWETALAQSVFGCTPDALHARRKLEWRCLPNLFPYDVPIGTWHYVVWIRDDSSRCVRFSVDQYIQQCLDAQVGKHQYEYIWYENTKKSCADPLPWLVNHYHVFWTLIRCLPVH